MPAVARGNGRDTVFSKTGTARCCAYHINTSTNQCSSNVFVNNVGVVRQGDAVTPHPFGGGCCTTDNFPLTTFSNKVFINDRGAGRIGDEYTTDNIITSGSVNVFFG